MRDSGLVISIKEGIAQVEVNCLESCQGCSAKSLCIGHAQSKGLLSAKNPIKASPGDEVVIDIPETKYAKALIVLFGSLLLASLAGMTVGYFSSNIIPLSSSASTLFGLFLGLTLAGGWLYRYFRKRDQDNLYPVIINITKKGEAHE